MSENELKEFQNFIDYRFKNEALLRQALTTPMRGNELGIIHYDDILETLGDSVLKTIFILKKYKEEIWEPEIITKTKQALENNETLTYIANKYLKLEKFIFKSEYQQIEYEIMASKWKYREIDISLDVFLHCYPLREIAREAAQGYVSCQAGRTRMSIDSQGTVYPCNLVISDPKWNVGNALQTSIQDIWFSNKWRTFRGDMKINHLEKCRDCRKLKGCKDFYCRLLPYIITGNLFGSHPKCLIPS